MSPAFAVPSQEESQRDFSGTNKDPSMRNWAFTSGRHCCQRHRLALQAISTSVYLLVLIAPSFAGQFSALGLAGSPSTGFLGFLMWVLATPQLLSLGLLPAACMQGGSE